MPDQKEYIPGTKHEIVHAIYIGGKDVVFAEDLTHKDYPYMVADGEEVPFLGVMKYENAVGSKDYLEMFKEFTDRLDAGMQRVQEQQNKITVPLDMFTAEHVMPDDRSQDINGKVVVLDASSLCPEYRSAPYQLAYVTGGFGASGKSRGQQVGCNILYTSEHETYHHRSILGVIKFECIPEWARERLVQIKEQEQGKGHAKRTPDRDSR